MLVVVDPHALVARGGGQEADEAGLSHGSLSLDQDWVGPARSKGLIRAGH